MAKKDKNNPFNDESLDEIQDTDVVDSVENLQPSTLNPQLSTEYDRLNQQYIRLAADFDNFRKRQEAEREELLKFGTQNALKKLIDVLDNFERGQKAIENIQDCEQVKESFDKIHKQTLDVLQKLGMEVIDTQGQQFDPNFHDAVMQTPTNEYPEHTIINELQKGYKTGDKVLRPALVNVAVEG
ncbi:MAG: nucleotide exchange factor GrpE [Heliobacteriaceae bacterium]|jgi:molecular chaperone GrpE|nr:nucleotide exchange factor GrpE [Heliobacteriaceae bacterium]